MKKQANMILLAIMVIGGLLYSPINKEAKASADDTFYGVNITNSANYTSSTNQAVPFDSIMFGLTSMWNSADPTVIKIPLSGVWLVGADITALGLNYISVGGVTSERVIIEIVKNWCGNELICPHLYADIAGTRFEYQNPYAANLNSMSSPVYLEEGDELELLLTGKTSTLLIESNPNGSGTISPHFYAIYLGALP